MRQLVERSEKAVLTVEAVSSLEANASQFISSSLQIISSLQQKLAPTDLHGVAVIDSLDSKLSHLVSKFKEWEERRIKRLIQRKAPQLLVSNATPSKARHAEPSAHSIPAAQLEMLQRERRTVIAEQDQDLQAIQRAQETLQEISRMQATIERQVVSQSEKIQSIYDDTIDIQATMRKGNDQLLRSRKSSSDFRFFLIFVLAVASASLLFLNWYK